MAFEDFDVKGDMLSIDAGFPGSPPKPGRYKVVASGTDGVLMLLMSSNGDQWLSKSGTITLAKDGKSATYKATFSSDSGRKDVKAAGSFAC